MDLDGQPAAAGLASAVKDVSYEDLVKLWQASVEQGKLQLSEEALAQFAEQQALLKRSDADLDQLKGKMMGQPTAMLLTAEELLAKGEDWEGNVHSFEQAVGPDQLQVLPPEYAPRWDRRGAGGCHRLTLTATAAVRLPTYREWCSLQGASAPLIQQDLPFSNDPDFATEQLMEAPYLYVRVKSYSTTTTASRHQSFSAKTSAEQQEIAKLRPRLHSHIAALLKWLLRWQLKAEQRKLLDELPGFRLLELEPTAAGTVTLVSTLGV
jgi:hypothetical protein